MSNLEHIDSSWLMGRFSKFVCRSSSRKATLVETLWRFRKNEWHVYVFGGTIRDISLHGPSVIPRDIDLVVDNCDIDDIANEFGPFIRRKTRFGGLNLNVDGWGIDVWPLRETWAFRTGVGGHCSFARLPQTTFLNVEAVAMELDADRGYPRALHEDGFIESLRNRVIEINLVENPFPALCVVRSLVMAISTKFRIGPRLARYIYEQSSAVSINDFVDIQQSHYGLQKLNECAFSRCLDVIQYHVEHSPDKLCRLPSLAELQSGQLQLPMY